MCRVWCSDIGRKGDVLIVDVFGCWEYLHCVGWCDVVRWCGGVVKGGVVVGGWRVVHCGVVRRLP